MMREESTTGNIGLAIWRLTEFLSAFVLKETAGILISFSARNPPHRQAVNRWWQCGLTHPNMAKLILTILVSFCLTHAFGQLKPKGTFIGLIPMKGYDDPAKPKYKWYHLSELTFKGDSVFLEQSPVAIFNKDTIFSASDGGFYSYHGTLDTYKGKTVVSLTLTSCDYCPMQMVRFTPPKIVNDLDTSTVLTSDTSTVIEEPKEIENPRLKYKTYFVKKTKSDREILVNKVVFRRRKT